MAAIAQKLRRQVGGAPTTGTLRCVSVAPGYGEFRQGRLARAGDREKITQETLAEMIGHGSVIS
jgi:hypothetical protein